MKKYILVLTLSLSAFYVLAQDFGTGVRFGQNWATNTISEIFKDPDSTEAYVTGLSAAAIFDIHINKYTAFQPEFRYSQSETNYNISPDSLSEMGLVFSKIEIPALFKVKVGTDILKINLLAGPNFAFVTRAYNEVRSRDSDESTVVVKTDIDKSTINNFEYSNIAGFGLTVIFNDFALFADYRYNFKFRKFNSVRQNGFINNLGSNIGGGFIFYY